VSDGLHAGAVQGYAEAGLVFGTVIAGPFAPAAAMSSNAVLSACMVSCAESFPAPTP